MELTLEWNTGMTQLVFKLHKCILTEWLETILLCKSHMMYELWVVFQCLVLVDEYVSYCNEIHKTHVTVICNVLGFKCQSCQVVLGSRCCSWGQRKGWAYASHGTISHSFRTDCLFIHSLHCVAYSLNYLPSNYFRIFWHWVTHLVFHSSIPFHSTDSRRPKFDCNYIHYTKLITIMVPLPYYGTAGYTCY